MISKSTLDGWLPKDYKQSKSRKSIFGKAFLREQKKGKNNISYRLKHF